MQYGEFCFTAAVQSVCEETETESSRVHCILLDHIKPDSQNFSMLPRNITHTSNITEQTEEQKLGPHPCKQESSQIHSLNVSENIVQLFGVPQVCSRFVKKSQLYSNQHTFLIHPLPVMKCQQSIIENFNKHPLLSVIIFTSASSSFLQVVNQYTTQVQQDL